MSRSNQVQQNSLQAYSPEYSSPFSSNSLLQARFNKASEQGRRAGKYGRSTKENYLEAPLPVFKEMQTSQEQMIPQVFEVDSDTYENGGPCQAILSDISDEMLIKQLQLNNMIDRGQHGLSGAAFQSSSNFESSTNCQNQPLREKKNWESPPSQAKLQPSYVKSKEMQTNMPQKLVSPQKHNFVSGKTNQSFTWSKNYSVISSQEMKRRNNHEQRSNVLQESSSEIQYQANMLTTESAPQPQPYQVAQCMQPYEAPPTHVFHPAQKNYREPSPPIQTEEDFQAFVQTNSSKNLETQLAWSSASPGVVNPSLSNSQQNYQETRQQTNVFKFNAATNNSTIQEMPTEEQLQGQSQTGITCQPSATLYPLSQVMPLVNEPQIMLDGANIGQEGLIGESESIEQIKMINKVIQHSKYPQNYSPDKQHQLSDSSLKDFSVTNDALRVISNDQMSSSFNANKLFDFDKNCRPHTDQNFNQATAYVQYQSNTSLAAHKDSDTTCQDVRQKAMPNVIQIQQKYQKNTSGCLTRPNMHRMGEKSRKLVNSVSTEKSLSQKSVGNTTASKKSYLSESLQKQIVVSRPGSTRVRSPVIQKIYGQCQATSEELYKPILKTSNSKAIAKVKKQSVPPMTKAKSPLYLNCPYTGTDSRTPPQPSFVSPSTAAPPLRQRSDSNSNQVRRNLGPQLNSQKSMSHSPSEISPLKAKMMGTMLHQYGMQQNSLQRKEQFDRTRNDANPGLRGNKDQSSKGHYNVMSSTQSNSQQTTNPVNGRYGGGGVTNASTNRISIRPNKPNQGLNSNLMHQKINNNSAVQGGGRSAAIPSRTTPATFLNKPSAIQQPVSAAPPQQQMVDQTQSTLKASSYQLRRATEAMKGLDIQMFMELERIKKPQAAILAIARMSCIFFEALRNRDPVIMDQVETMQSWLQIQEYIRTQLTCCVPELRTLLKKKMIAWSKFQEGGEGAAQSEIVDLEKIRQTFFIDSKIRVIRRFIQSSKLLKGLVSLIYAFICVALDLEREFKLDNLLSLTEQPQIRIEEVKFVFATAQQQNLEANRKQNASSSILNRSREGSLDGIKNLTIEQEKDNSYCSKCSGSVGKSIKSKQSNVSKVSRERMSNQSRESQERLLIAHQQAQINKNSSNQDNGKINLQMNVFKTLEDVYVNQDSHSSQQSHHKTFDIRRGKQSMPALSVQGGSEERKHEFQTIQNNSNSNYYTSAQFLKLQQPKPRISAAAIDQPNADNGFGLMNVMDEYEQQSGNPFQKNDQVFRQSLDLSQLNNNDHQEPALITMKNRQYVDNKGRSVPSYMAPTKAQAKRQQDVTTRVSKRRSTVCTSQVFVSSLKTNNNTNNTQQFNTPNSGLTPKANRFNASSRNSNQAITPKQTSITGFSQRYSIRPSAANSRQADAPQKKERLRKDISPASTTSSYRPQMFQQSKPTIFLSKTASQQKKPQPQNQPTNIHHVQTLQQPRHQRVSTLYKTTATQQAKIKPSVHHQSSSKSPLARDASVKSMTKDPSQIFRQQLSRKTKSQTNLKVLQPNKRSTTPTYQGIAREQRFALRHQKRENAQQRNLNAQKYEPIVPPMLPTTILPANNEQQRSQHQSFDNLVKDTMPSFGADQFPQQIDINVLSSIVVNERQSTDFQDKKDKSSSSYEKLMAIRNTIAAPSFQQQIIYTPDKMTFNDNDQPDSSAPLQTPVLQNILEISPYNHHQLTTAELGNDQQQSQIQFTSERQTMVEQSMLEEPLCAADCAQQNEQRTQFILQQAQAITENINSCTKQHNMPQIDMATIEKLKMRRMQYMKQSSVQISETASPNKHINNQHQWLQQQQSSEIMTRQRQSRAPPTPQSCNVITTMTVETTIPAEDERLPPQPTSQKDVSFTEALNKLKAEVESLMYNRIQRQI